MELVARGNVVIQGSTERGESFEATAQRASFTQLKDLFILEGDANASATIKYWRQAGIQPLVSAARKITYHRATGDVKAEEIRSLDLAPAPGDSFAPRPALGPTPQRR